MSKKKKIIIGVVSAVVGAMAITGIVLAVVFSSKGPFSGKVIDAETGEPIPGVSVTDGRYVVKTAEDGTFTLKGYYKSSFVTVTTPAGYTTENFYIPVSRKTKSYDFALEKSAATAAAEHSFAQISDTEINNKTDVEWLDHVKKVVDETDAAFLIHTGDICYEEGLKRHKTVMNKDNMGVPVRWVIGNHDYVKGKYGEKLYEENYGPIWYSFEVGNVHYVVLPFQEGSDFKSGYNKNDRWRWLENDLANTSPDMKVVVFNHTNSPSDDYVISFDRKELDLKQHNLIAWVYGHYHYNYVNENNGVVNISTARPDCGGIDSSASGTRLVSIDAEGKVTTKMYYYDLPNKPEIAENAVWSRELGNNILFTDTVSANGKIYTATTDDDYPSDCGIYCLDEATGEIIWFVPAANSVKNDLVYADGKIVAQDAEGNVVCLNAENGEKVWSAKAELNRSLGTNTGICSDGTVVFVGSSLDVTALNLADGKTLWAYHRQTGENSAAGFIAVGDKLIISPHWDALVALDKNSGTIVWENNENGVRFRSSTPVAVDDKTVLVADDKSVFILNADTGEMSSCTAFGDYNFATSAQPVIDSGKAYIPTANKGLIAFDIESKKIVWEMMPEQAMVYTAPYTHGDAATVESTPLLKDGQLIFGASDGYVYRVNAADGQVIAKAFIGAPVFGKVVLCADGSVIAADFAGRVTRTELA